MNLLLGIIVRLSIYAQEPWNQAHFEELLAKWVAACDQPFTAVADPEFQDLLRYVHLHTGRVLRIPAANTIQRRILALGDEVEEKLKKQLAVC